MYAAVLKPSENGEYVITSLDMRDASSRDNFSGIINGVNVLGTAEKPVWERRSDELHICTNFPNGDYHIMFKIEID